MERPRTSEILRDLAAAHQGPRVSLGEVVDALDERGFGVLILVLTLPNLVPGPPTPGLSTVLSIPLAFLAAQLAAGREEPQLPRWLLRRSMTLAGFRRLVAYATPAMERVERLSRPRPGVPEQRLLGLALLAVIVAFAMPIPLASLPPTAALILIALGLIERDGRAVRIGLALAVPACLWVVGLVFGGYQLLSAIFS